MLLGLTGDPDLKKQVADPEQAGIIMLAWRALYAETTKAHIHDTPFSGERAYIQLCRLARMRLTDFGEKWRLWHIKLRNTSLPCIVSLSMRARCTLIKIEDTGDYTVNDLFIKEIQRVLAERAARQ